MVTFTISTAGGSWWSCYIVELICLALGISRESARSLGCTTGVGSCFFLSKEGCCWLRFYCIALVVWFSFGSATGKLLLEAAVLGFIWGFTLLATLWMFSCLGIEEFSFYCTCYCGAPLDPFIASCCAIADEPPPVPALWAPHLVRILSRVGFNWFCTAGSRSVKLVWKA